MLIHAQSKSIVLKLRDPERVSNIIPTAKVLDFQGDKIVAIPHRLDEVRVLRNLGFRAPSPVTSHYKWSGQYRPFFAQRETVDFLTLNPKAFVLNDLGTGKTLAALWAFDYLRSIGKATKLLIVCPLSTMERTWADEVFRHFPHLTFSVLYGTSERRRKLLAQDADVYIVNHHGLKILLPELAGKRPDIDVVVLDELAIYRNQSTELWKSANALVAGRPRVWGLTGTPTPNAPTDAYGQVKLIAPERIPKYFGKFRDGVMRQLGQFKWVARDTATETVHEALQPSIRFTRDQCVDLPPAIYQTRHAALSVEQAKAYKDMAGQLFTEYQGGQVQAVNEAVKLAKLVQIACGVVYGKDSQEIVLPSKARLDELRDVIQQANSKVIVFVPYKAVISWLAAELTKDYPANPQFVRNKVTGQHGYQEGDAVAVVSGDVGKSERDRIFAAFQSDLSGLKILVAQPGSMSHGLTLTAANTIVWYAPVTSHETYLQANGRITRPGQRQTQFVVHLEGTSVERKIYMRLQNKEKMQGMLLEAVKESFR
jgi:SNF2 family DNA or RNA helicase